MSIGNGPSPWTVKSVRCRGSTYSASIAARSFSASRVSTSCLSSPGLPHPAASSSTSLTMSSFATSGRRLLRVGLLPSRRGDEAGVRRAGVLWHHAFLDVDATELDLALVRLAEQEGAVHQLADLFVEFLLCHRL